MDSDVSLGCNHKAVLAILASTTAFQQQRHAMNRAEQIAIKIEQPNHAEKPTVHWPDWPAAELGTHRSRDVTSTGR